MKTVFLQLCLVGTLVQGLNAQTVFDNTAAISNGADCIEVGICGFTPGELYASFSSGSAPGSISTLDLGLSGDNNSLGAFVVSLYADNSTQPGGFIADLGTFSDSGLVNGFDPSIYGVALTNFPSLQPDTRYWIGLSGTTAALWSWSFDTSGIGVASEFFSNPEGTFNSSNGPYQMAVGVSSTPEIPTIVLLMIGIAGLFLHRRISWM
jgi:hypothetical protein